MGALVKRLVSLTLLLAAVAASGGVHRWWNRPKAAADGGPTAEQELAELGKRMQRQRAELHKQVDELPADQRAVFADALAATEGRQEAVSPILKLLSEASFEKRAEKPTEEEEAARAARFEMIWRKASEVSVYLLWAAVLVVILAGVWGTVKGDAETLAAASAAGTGTAHYWLLGMSFLAAALFSWSEEDVWGEMPVTFYLAPVVCLAASFLLRLGDDKDRTALQDALEALCAPVASCAVLAVLRHLL